MIRGGRKYWRYSFDAREQLELLLSSRHPQMPGMHMAAMGSGARVLHSGEIVVSNDGSSYGYLSGSYGSYTTFTGPAVLDQFSYSPFSVSTFVNFASDFAGSPAGLTISVGGAAAVFARGGDIFYNVAGDPTSLTTRNGQTLSVLITA